MNVLAGILDDDVSDADNDDFERHNDSDDDEEGPPEDLETDMTQIANEEDSVEISEPSLSDSRDQSSSRADSEALLTATNEGNEAVIDALEISKVTVTSVSTNSGESVSRDDYYDNNLSRDNADTDTKYYDDSSNGNGKNDNGDNNGDNNVKSSGSNQRDLKDKKKKGDQQTKRPRTDSVVSSGSTGTENLQKPVAKRSVSSNLPKAPRPKNMFDITEMSYEQYVDRHYAIKYEQWFQESNMNAFPGSLAGMGPGGMPLPMVMAMAANMMGGGGYFGGQGLGAFGPGPMMMGPGMGGMGGMGMGGPINPMMMHDGGMFQGINMHNENIGQNGSNHMYNERGKGGRGGRGRGQQRF